MAGALTDEVRAVALAAGLDAVGITPAVAFDDTRRVLEERKAAGLAGTMAFTYRNPARSSDPTRALRNARSIVVAARSYLRTPPENRGRPGRSGRVARYAWADDYAALRSGLARVGERLAADGHRSVVLVDDNALVDRAAAVRAGVGWYGNNSLVLLPGRGSWYVLGSLVTDAPLDSGPPDTQPGGGGCGTCTRCLPACPTGALVEPGVLDARRCLAWIVQAPGIVPRRYREVIGDRIYGCDDCQDACPVNRTAARHHPPQQPGDGLDDHVDVVALLAAGDEEILARYGRWYLADRDPAVLRRNALIVLGNTGDPADPEVRAAVAGALGSPQPVVRAHAVWAAARLGLGVEAAALGADPDDDVRAEVAAMAGVDRSDGGRRG